MHPELQRAISTAVSLTFPNNEDPYILDTDASNDAVGGTLYQVQNGREQPISFASVTFSQSQKKYCTTRKELLAIVLFSRRFRHYLLGRQFTFWTDHGSLTWLYHFKNPTGQLGRWLEELSQFDIIIQHRPGNKRTNADGLSRIPCMENPCTGYHPEVELEELPCGDCHHCQNLQK